MRLRTYSFYIRDRRYSVPTLQLVDLGAEEQIGDLARAKLEESEHHLAVEVVDGENVLFRVSRDGRD